MEFSSRLLEEAVNQISKLPGIGKKTALRLALFLIREPASQARQLTDAISNLRANIQICRICFNISDEEVCSICKSPRRDRSVVCVVEDMRDVMAIENTAQFQGLYHVLGGVISPVNGIGPGDLRIESLVTRVAASGSELKEVILALSPTMEGDTTAFYIHKKLAEFKIRVSSIARGVPVGGDLEYADEITLGRSILARTIM
jgi:recombination protein RecR